MSLAEDFKISPRQIKSWKEIFTYYKPRGLCDNSSHPHSKMPEMMVDWVYLIWSPNSEAKSQSNWRFGSIQWGKAKKCCILCGHACVSACTYICACLYLYKKGILQSPGKAVANTACSEICGAWPYVYIRGNIGS